jgi:outer membrane protein OmpA-like peptidoglycan-associated protein
VRALTAYCLGIAIVLAAGAAPRARADVSASATEASVEASAPAQDSALKHWWFGGYYRHLWMPSYFSKAFLARAPSVTNDGFGVVATYRTLGGLNVEMGFGYMPYAFRGPFLGRDSDVTDTELARSDLGFYHVTSSLLWDIEFHRVIALELGFGIDVGLFTGNVVRNEAYLDPKTGHFADCVGPLNPPVVGPSPMPGVPGVPYCNTPENGSGVTDKADEKGEQYHVRDTHVPPVLLFPMLPHVALRIQPIEYVAIKAEFAFGIAQMWVGASLHVNFGWAKHSATPEPVAPQAVAAAPVATGRVLGRVLDTETSTAVAGATVTLKAARALSPFTTDAEGRFMVDRLDAGQVRFAVEHADYAAAECQTEIPKQGGDVPLDCHLSPKPRVGAISGQVQSEDGKPVATPGIELVGPRNDKLSSDERGLFAAVDLPTGAYRIRIEADGYLMQVVEVSVESHETAMPQIILIKKPKRSLVTLHKEEIVIAEQIQFKPSSAEILAESESLLRQVTDVILRHPQIELLEVQGHTDSKGGHDMNMQLSQARAESVRDFLVKAGVGSERLEAKGYGPDHPIRPNDTAQNRAKNRRVQFILLRQASEPAEGQK